MMKTHLSKKNRACFKLALMAAMASLSLAMAPCARAQEAPPPKNAPRTPVHQQILAGSKSAPASRVLDGTATVLDTERLRIEQTDVRLFGIVPPQLSAPYGPQARAVLDKLNAAGDVTCAIRDRDRDGRFLATCHNAQRADFALELLRRGLAVTARGSLHNADVAPAYLATEQTAQNQKLGLWSQTIPQAASETSIRDTAMGKDLAALSPKKDKEPESAPTQATPTPQPVVATPTPTPQQAPHQSAQPPQLEPQAPAPAFIKPANAATAPALEDLVMPPVQPPASVLETYQILLTGLLLSLTGFAGLIGFWRIRRWEHREDVRTLAAALRGELMAARSICVARLAVMTAPHDDKNQASATAWPRIRTTVFQAMAAKLGLLGAELSRQIASIYGQASDYAAYYAAPQTTATLDSVLASKLKALDCLVLYIDEVLPRLAALENEDRGAFSFAPPRPPQGGKPRPTPLAKNEAPTPSAAKPQILETKDQGTVVDNGEKAESSPVHDTKAVAPQPAQPPEKAATTPAASAIWDKIKSFTNAHLATNAAGESCPVDGDIDYSSLSAEEMEALAYGEGPAAERAARAVATTHPEGGEQGARKTA